MSDAVVGEVPTQSSFTAFPRMVPAHSSWSETVVTYYSQIRYDGWVLERGERHRAEYRSTKLTNDKCRYVPNSSMWSEIRQCSRQESCIGSCDDFGITGVTFEGWGTEKRGVR